jgi:hypothetical protein
MKTEIKELKVNQLNINSKNPRKISEVSYRKLKKSLTEFKKMLNIREIVCDENMNVLGGNMRVKALLELNPNEKVKVKIVKGLSEEEKKEFIIKDNVSSGLWDYELLRNEFTLEQLNDWDLFITEGGLDKDIEDFLEYVPPSENKIKQLCPACGQPIKTKK